MLSPPAIGGCALGVQQSSDVGSSSGADLSPYFAIPYRTVLKPYRVRYFILTEIDHENHGKGRSFKVPVHVRYRYIPIATGSSDNRQNGAIHRDEIVTQLELITPPGLETILNGGVK